MQLGGAVGVLAWPAVLLAGVMGIAAPGGGPAAFFARLALAASVAYPVAYALLFFLSWRALGRGRTGLAFVLSAVPLAVTAGTALLLALGVRDARAIRRGYEEARAREAVRVRGESSLAGSLLLFQEGRLSWPQLQGILRAADEGELSRPVVLRPADVPGLRVQKAPGAPPDPVRRRTPLAIALAASPAVRTFEARPDDRFLEAARELLARGARLSDEERSGEPVVAWLADVVAAGRALPDRRAEEENPLAWAIVASPPNEEPRVAEAIYAAARREPELLRRPTTTYGTPLRAALLRARYDRARDLVRNGAVLSEEERALPGAAASLERFLALPVNEGLREVYDASLRGGGAR